MFFVFFKSGPFIIQAGQPQDFVDFFFLEISPLTFNLNSWLLSFSFFFFCSLMAVNKIGFVLPLPSMGRKLFPLSFSQRISFVSILLVHHANGSFLLLPYRRLPHRPSAQYYDWILTQLSPHPFPPLCITINLWGRRRHPTNNVLLINFCLSSYDIFLLIGIDWAYK